ncbi:unnamed protein product [Durusdinium trenchii]|uniref:Protochlorophyllide reductase n=1 Tax=Durusdinium trenchii TaxID=1381693 RepID=A0ABP0P0I7_9DINO
MRFPARSWKSVRSCAFVGFSFGVLLWPQVRLMASQGGGYGARTMPTCGVYLVTGATDGIGRYTAELLVKQRHVVLVHGRSVQRVKDTVARLERLGGEAHGFVADLSLMSDVRKLAQEVSEKFPVLHGLLNNAGTFDGDYTGKRLLATWREAMMRIPTSRDSDDWGRRCAEQRGSWQCSNIVERCPVVVVACF